MTDLHGMSGRTMSAGEAELRAKLKSLIRRLETEDSVESTLYAASLIDKVLTGELDPRTEVPQP